MLDESPFAGEGYRKVRGRLRRERWGTDGTMAWTQADGWAWVFAPSTTTPPRPGDTWPRWATSAPGGYPLV